MKEVDDSERVLEVANVAWHELEPHLLRDALIVVGNNLAVEEVAKVVAADDTEQVQKWIDEGSLSKPSADQVKLWEKERMTEFKCAIVQPFVLMQELPE